jgi:hypothetical protein
MRKRILLGVGVVAGLAVLGVVGLWLAIPKHPINREGLGKIRAGMSLPEVEAVLGRPPGNYRTGEVDLDLSQQTGEFENVMFAPEVVLGKRHFRHEWWQGDEGNLWVCFDEQDRVVTKEFTPGVCRPPDMFAWLRRWLGL